MMRLCEKLRLYVITDRRFGKEVDIAKKVLECGATAIQLRMKDVSDREFYETSLKIRKITDEYSALFIVNDRVDIAIMSGADGVHLGNDDLPPEDVKENFPELIVGATVRDLKKAKKMEKNGIDYIGVGSVFPSPTKKAKVVGIDTLYKIAKETNIPVVAIGGITVDKIREVMKCGVCGVAVISGILNSYDICETTKKFLSEIFNSINS